MFGTNRSIWQSVTLGGAGIPDFYVDSAAAPGGDGLSPETAWDSMADVTAALGVSILPGHVVGIAADSNFNESFAVTAGGSAGNYITFKKFGAGADPIIGGSFNHAVDISNNVGYLVFDRLNFDTFFTTGIRGLEVEGFITIKRCTFNSQNAGGAATTAGVRFRDIVGTHSGFISVVDCDIQQIGNANDTGTISSGITLEGIKSGYIARNTIHTTFVRPIKLGATGGFNCIDTLIEDNEIYNCYTGVSLNGDQNTVFKNNVLRDYQGAGVAAIAGSTGATIEGNLIKNLTFATTAIQRHGLSLNGGINGTVQFNTIANVDGASVFFGAATTGWTVKDNILDWSNNPNSGTAPSGYRVTGDAASFTYTGDTNLFYPDAGAFTVTTGPTSYDLAGWVVANGQETTSYANFPFFVDETDFVIYTVSDAFGNATGGLNIGYTQLSEVRPTLFYVDANATGTGDGTSWTDAFTSLAAITPMVAGDTITIADGTTYNEQLFPQGGTLGDPIIYKSEGLGPQPIIDAGGATNAVVMAATSHVTIDGLKVVGFDDCGIYANNSEGLTIVNNYVTGGNSAGSGAIGIRATNAGASLLEGVVIQGNTVYHIQDVDTQPVFDDSATSLAGGIVTSGLLDADISNNTIETRYVPGIKNIEAGGAASRSSGIEIYDNYLYDCNTSILVTFSDACFIHDNEITRGKGSGVAVTNGSDVCKIHNNLIYNLTEGKSRNSGIFINGTTAEDVDDGECYNNTVYSVVGGCIEFGLLNTGWNVRNNIFDASKNSSASLVASPRAAVRTNTEIFASTWVWASDYNTYVPMSDGNTFVYGAAETAVTYSAWLVGEATFSLNTLSHANSTDQDPLFQRTSVGDFTPATTGVAYLSGVELGYGTNIGSFQGGYTPSADDPEFYWSNVPRAEIADDYEGCIALRCDNVSNAIPESGEVSLSMEFQYAPTATVNQFIFKTCFAAGNGTRATIIVNSFSANPSGAVVIQLGNSGNVATASIDSSEFVDKQRYLLQLMYDQNGATDNDKFKVWTTPLTGGLGTRRSHTIGAVGGGTVQSRAAVIFFSAFNQAVAAAPFVSEIGRFWYTNEAVDFSSHFTSDLPAGAATPLWDFSGNPDDYNAGTHNGTLDKFHLFGRGVEYPVGIRRLSARSILPPDATTGAGGTQLGLNYWIDTADYTGDSWTNIGTPLSQTLAPTVPTIHGTGMQMGNSAEGLFEGAFRTYGTNILGAGLVASDPVWEFCKDVPINFVFHSNFIGSATGNFQIRITIGENSTENTTWLFTVPTQVPGSFTLTVVPDMALTAVSSDDGTLPAGHRITQNGVTGWTIGNGVGYLAIEYEGFHTAWPSGSNSRVFCAYLGAFSGLAHTPVVTNINDDGRNTIYRETQVDDFDAVEKSVADKLAERQVDMHCSLIGRNMVTTGPTVLGSFLDITEINDMVSSGYIHMTTHGSWKLAQLQVLTLDITSGTPFTAADVGEFLVKDLGGQIRIAAVLRQTDTTVDLLMDWGETDDSSVTYTAGAGTFTSNGVGVGSGNEATDLRDPTPEEIAEDIANNYAFHVDNGLDQDMMLHYVYPLGNYRAQGQGPLIRVFDALDIAGMKTARQVGGVGFSAFCCPNTLVGHSPLAMNGLSLEQAATYPQTTSPDDYINKIVKQQLKLAGGVHLTVTHDFIVTPTHIPAVDMFDVIDAQADLRDNGFCKVLNLEEIYDELDRIGRWQPAEPYTDYDIA